MKKPAKIRFQCYEKLNACMNNCTSVHQVYDFVALHV